MHTRHIPLEGTSNLRDLGEYPSRCGRKVKRGKLFRSGTLAYLSDSDWQTLAAYNIGVVCDFRSDRERRAEPTKPPPGTDFRLINLTIDPGDHYGWLVRSLDEKSGTSAQAIEIMCTINREFALKFSNVYREFLHTIVNLPSDKSLLFHCSAGKDRTGFATALVLFCLNVDLQTIENDYLLTAHYYRPDEAFSRMLKKLGRGQGPDHQLAHLLPLFDVRREYLHSAFAAIAGNFESTEHYLEEVMQVDSSVLERLRDAYLE